MSTERICRYLAHVTFWKTKTIAKREIKNLASQTARLNAVKEQLEIHIIGFGWQDLHHPWSKEGHTYTANELLQYLTEKLIPEQTHRGIPTSPTMNMPSGKVTPQLGKRTADVAELEERYENEKQKAVEEAIKL